MPDPLASGDPFALATQRKPKSAFLSLLDTADKPGQIVRNLFHGNLEGAGRQFLDLLTSIPRALIPGDQSDWETARPEDNVHGSDLVGIDRQEHPLGAIAADVPIDILTDPLTYLSFGASVPLKAAARAAAASAEAANAVAKGAEGAGALTRAAELLKTGSEAENAAKGGVRLKIPFTDIGTPTILKGKNVDPLSLAGQGADKLASLLPEGGQKAYDALKLGTKSTLGWLNPAPAVGALLNRAQNTGASVAKTATDAAVEAVKGSTPEASQRAFQLLKNFTQDEKGIARPLGQQELPGPLGELRDLVSKSPLSESDRWVAEQRIKNAPWSDMDKDEALRILDGGDVEASKFGTEFDQRNILQKRLESAPWDDAQKAEALDLAMKASKVGRTGYAEGAKDFPIFNVPHGINPEEMAPLNYVQSQFSGIPDGVEEQILGVKANALKKAELDTGEKISQHLNENPGIKLEQDIAKPLIDRGVQQGQLAKLAELGKGLGGDAFKSLADPASRQHVADIIEGFKTVDPETHLLLSKAWNGLEARGPFMQAIANASKVFKPAATYGLAFPRVSGLMRNILAFGTQQVAEEGQPLVAAGRQILRTPQTVWNAMREGVDKAFGVRVPGDALGKATDQIEAAFNAAGGRYANVAKILKAQGRDDLASAVENGVIDNGFIRKEAIYDSLRNSSFGRKAMSMIGMGKKAQDRALDIVDAPAAAWQGAEQHGRLGNYLDLLKHGQKPEEAAKNVRDAFYDYSVLTEKNRTLRTLLPFAAFTSNAVRQQGKFLSRNLGAAEGLNAVYNQPDTGPIDPYLQGQLRIPTGKDEKGNDQYIAGLSLPVESLNQIPNLTGTSLPQLGSELRRSVLASSQPLLKTGYGVLTGKDPYFDSQFGSFDKIPGVGHAGEAGKAYNLAAGTGLLQPISTPLATIGRLLDDRTSIGDKLANELTGAKFVSVDPNRALQRQLEDELANNPDVQQHRSFYQQSKDPETQALIKAYNEAKKRIHDKHKKP